MIDQDEILYEIQKKLVATKQLFPTKFENRKGRNVVTEGVHTIDVLAFMQYLRDNYLITKQQRP